MVLNEFSRNESTPTVEQIREYTALAKRHSEILLKTGISWKPEYEEELRQIGERLKELKRWMELN